MAVFTDVIAARDLAIVDVADWDTPSADALPNGDAATQPNDNLASAARADTGADFAIPWGVSDWTLELWAYWTTIGSGGPKWLLTRWGTSTHREWELRVAGGANRQLRFALLGTDGETPLVNLDIICEDAAWTHCVWTLNSSLGAAPVSGREITSYKNGALDDTAAIGSGDDLTGPTLTTPGLYMGSVLGQITTPIVEWGKVAIYHRILTGGEISDHFDVMTA